MRECSRVKDVGSHRVRGLCKALGNALKDPHGGDAQILVQGAAHGACTSHHHSIKLLQAHAATLQFLAESQDLLSAVVPLSIMSEAERCGVALIECKLHSMLFCTPEDGRVSVHLTLWLSCFECGKG